MGVYIKGMEMPTDCIFCPMFHGAWTMCTVLNKTTSVRGRPDDCPLVPVPPHGRLIDADALKIEVFAHDKLMKDGWNNMDMGMFTGNLMEVIACAPTIIPAEEGKT